jgi:hypothetical protein
MSDKPLYVITELWSQFLNCLKQSCLENSVTCQVSSNEVELSIKGRRVVLIQFHPDARCEFVYELIDGGPPEELEAVFTAEGEAYFRWRGKGYKSSDLTKTILNELFHR